MHCFEGNEYFNMRSGKYCAFCEECRHCPCESKTKKDPPHCELRRCFQCESPPSNESAIYSECFSSLDTAIIANIALIADYGVLHYFV